MALKQSISVSGPSVIHTPFGPVEGAEQTVSADCYIKVQSVSATKSQAVAYVHYFEEGEDAAETAPKFSKTFEFGVNLEGANFIAQAYEHLKALPEFADAIDC